MRASIISIILSAPLILALPTVSSRAGPQSASITLKTGDGDSSVGFSVAVNKLVPATAQSNAGVSAETFTTGVFCQAFSDAHGFKKLGGVFSSTSGAASFTSASSGDVDSSADQAVPIGAYCCVTSVHGFGACKAEYSFSNSTSACPTALAATTSGSSNSSSNCSSATPTSSSTPISTSTPSTSKTVRVEFTGEDELAAQADIAADNSVVLIANSDPLFPDVVTAEIVSGNGIVAPSCQAFSDAKGLVKVGERFGLELVALGDGTHSVTVLSIRCRCD